MKTIKCKCLIDINTGKPLEIKTIHLWDAVFKANTYIIQGPSSGTDVTKWFKSRGVDYESQHGEFQGRTLTLDGGLNVHIFLKDTPCEAEYYATLAHEAYHAAHIILSFRGQLNQDQDGEEAHAYYIGWIIKEFISRNKPVKKKSQKESS